MITDDSLAVSSPSRNSLPELEDDPSLPLRKSCAAGPKTNQASTPSKVSTISNLLTANSPTTNSGSHQPQMKRRSASQSLSDQSSSVGTMPNIATPPAQEPTMMGVNIADFSVSLPDLDKMRTFPTSVPLPDLDGDLEFLDFFDPFLGMEPKQMGNFAIPPVSMSLESWSPLEHFSCSSQTSMQDYGFLQATEHTSTEPVMIDGGEAALAHVPEHDSIHEQRPSFETAFEDINPGMVPTEPGEQSAPKLARTPFTKPPALLFTEEMRCSKTYQRDFHTSKCPTSDCLVHLRCRSVSGRPSMLSMSMYRSSTFKQWTLHLHLRLSFWQSAPSVPFIGWSGRLRRLCT